MSTAKDDKRNRILQTMLRLVTENGFHGTPMSMVAKESQLGAGTIYRYFENKEAVINELYATIKAEVNEAVLSGFSLDMPIKEKILLRCKNILIYYIEHPIETKFMEQYASSPFLSEDVVESSKKLFQHNNDLFTEAKHQGIIKDVPLEVIWSLILGTISQLSRYHAKNARVVDEAILQMFSDIIWDGLAK